MAMNTNSKKILEKNLQSILDDSVDIVETPKPSFTQLVAKTLELSSNYMHTHLPTKYKKDADDLAQDVTLAFLKSYTQGTFTYESETKFSSWVLKSSRNKAVDFYRTQKIELSDSLDLLDSIEDERSVIPKDNILCLRQEKAWTDFYNSLNDNQKQIIDRRLACEGICNAVIAENLGIQRSKIDTSAHYLRRRANNYDLKNKLLD